MATLTGNQIDLSYQGLIKTTDNAALGATEKVITDGVGNASTLKLGTASASFVGTLDLTGATVLGGGGAAGLVAGAGTSSMKSADDLTASNASANGSSAIALGEGAVANQDFSLSVGAFATAGIFSTSVGTYSEASGLYCSAFGPSSKATGDGAVALGQLSEASGAGSVGIGREAKAIGANAISIGSGNTKITNNISIGDANGDPYNQNTIAIGLNYPTDLDFRGDSVSIGNAIYPARSGVYIGTGANHTDGSFTHAIAIGKLAVTSGQGSISLGREASSTAEGAVALGQFVTASRANTATVKELELQTVGGGIFMKSPDGTVYKLTVANGGTLSVTAV